MAGACPRENELMAPRGLYGATHRGRWGGVAAVGQRTDDGGAGLYLVLVRRIFPATNQGIIMPIEETITVLNDLIQTSEDGKKGFGDAAKEATTVELKTMFQTRSIDCASAAAELQSLVETLGGKPKDNGTVAGAAHRGWAKVVAAIGDTNLSMLEEVERAEDKAKAAYTKALAATLPQQVRMVVQRQHDGAVRNHDLIRDVRNSYRAHKEATTH